LISYHPVYICAEYIDQVQKNLDALKVKLEGDIWGISNITGISNVVTICFGEEDKQVSLVAILIHSQVTRNGGMYPQI
jgi:hypothetical protein